MSLAQDHKIRFERNLLVEGFSEEKQEKLLSARVAVVGAGGLGSAALGYLTAAGTGSITIVENDVVSLSNLQRQLLYTTPDIGEYKAEVAAVRLSRLNPECRITIVTERLTEENCEKVLAGHDLILDCTDNYASRYVIDGFCGRNRIPMVYGTAEQIGGQVSVFHYAGAGSYGDLYPEKPAQRPLVGVLSPIVGVIGALEALEAVKILTSTGETLAGRLLIVDGWTMTFTRFNLKHPI